MAPQPLTKEVETYESHKDRNVSTEIAKRLLYIKTKAPYSWNYISHETGRAVSVLRKFAEGEIGDNPGLAQDVRRFVERHETKELLYQDPLVTTTGILKKVHKTLRYAQTAADFIILDGPAGSGKTIAIRSFIQQHPENMLATLDVVTRSPTSVLPLICQQVPIHELSGTSSKLLHRLIERLKNSQRLLILDESHFLSWECIEMVRRLHDAAQIGIALCGQERFYHQMKQPKSQFLWDQISSRIGMRHTIGDIEREDTDAICLTICPELDNSCLKILYNLAQGPGRFRIMTKVLEQAVKISEMDKTPISLSLLQDVAAWHII